MAILNFPDSPIGGSVYVAPNGVTYTYDATTTPGVWRATTSSALSVSPGSISGNPIVGATLTYTPGTPSGGTPPYAPATYQWKANGVNIGGATGTTYVVGAGYAGQSITVTITVQDSATPAASASATTAPLAILNAVTVTAGSISSGTPTVGVPLTYTPGTASGGTGSYNYTYQWKANGTAISGATSTTFSPTNAEVGQTLTVTITATDQTYPTLTANATTTATPAVAPAGIPSGTWNPSPALTADAFAASSGTWNGPAGTVITASGCVEVSTDGSTYGPTVTVTNPQVLYQRWKASCVGQKSTDTITGSLAAAGVGTNNYSLQLNHIPTNSLLAITSSNVPLGGTVSQASTSPMSGLNSPAYVTIAAAGNTGTNIQASTAAGGPWTTLATTGTGFQIANGQTLYIQQTVGGSTTTGYVAKIQVGDDPAVSGANFVAFDYTATTTSSASFPSSDYNPSPIGGPNASPDATNLSGPALVGTASGTWNGVSTSISTTGSLQYKINTGSWGQAASTVNSTDTLALRWDPTAADSAADAGSLTGTLTGTIGGTTYTNSYTLTVDKQPAAYTWTDVTSGAALSTQVSSNVITISDINCPAELTITAPGSDALSSVQASINGGTWTNIPTSSPGLTVDPADTLGTTATQIQIRGTTGGSTTTAYTITTNIGKGAAIVSDTWSVTTTGVVASIDTPSITSPTGSPPTLLNPALNSPAGIPLVSDTYSPQNGAGAQTSSTWEVVKANSINPQTSAIVSVNQTAQTPWTQRTSNVGLIYGVAYGNGVYVAVGASGQISSSPDGVTWTARTSGFGSSQIFDVAFGNGIFVAVGQAGTRIATSTDGITWTQRTSSITSDLTSIAFGNGVFVVGAGSNSGQIQTSTDGITWTQRTSGVAAGNVDSIVYGNGKFIAFIGSSWRISTDNGASWSAVSSQPAGMGGTASAYGNGRYVVGDSTGAMATSTNGNTWSSASSSFGSDAIDGMVYADNIFVAVGAFGKIATSFNGTTWTQQTNSFTAFIRGVTYGNGLFVAGGASGQLGTSPAPVGSTTLTLTDTTNLSSMVVGDSVVEVGGGADASGTIVAITPATPSITVTSNTNWTAGATAKDTSRTIIAPAPTGAATAPDYTAVTGSPFTVSSAPFTTKTVPQSALAISSRYYARVQYATTNTTAATSAFSGWSSFATASAFVPNAGQAMGGGYFAGQINDGGTIYNLIVAPKLGDTSGPNPSGTLQGQRGGTTPTVISYKTSNTGDLPADQNLVYGGTTSDRYKASADHPLFNTTWLSGSTGPNGGTINLATGGLGGGSGIGGYTDWYVPAKNELEILYYNLKPTTNTNNTTGGMNSNAVPSRSTNYTASNPAQTTVTEFQGSNAQAFSTFDLYWCTSEYVLNDTSAWLQSFSDGLQGTNGKSGSRYARAIRRVQA